MMCVKIMLKILSLNISLNYVHRTQVSLYLLNSTHKNKICRVERYLYIQIHTMKNIYFET